MPLTRRSLIVVLGVLSFAATLFAQSAPVAGTRPACVSVSPQPVFNGTGYNHLVSIVNQCSAAVTCSVTTNVNPRAIESVVPAGER